MGETEARLGVITKLSYGVGQVAEGLKNTAIATFVLFYYNQVLGLSGTLAGLALGVALVFDAVTDPLAGSLSDNLNSRLGRRHPFMYASALPLGVAFFLLFAPPSGMSQWVLFAWLLMTILLTRAAMTLYHVPHIALGAELTSDYEERTRVVAYRTFFGTFGGLLAYLVGFGFFFTDARGGQLNAANYAPYALIVSVLMAGTILWSALGTRARIPFLPKAPKAARVDMGDALLRVFRDLGAALKNRSFRWLFSGVLILFVMIGLDSALNLYMFNYFWELEATQILWLFLALPLGAMIGATMTPLVQRLIEKHTGVLFGTTWFAVWEVIPVLLRLLDWFPENGTTELFVTLLVIRLIMGIGSVHSTVSFNSMMADIADEHELLTHRRQEGIFFGAISFSAKGTSGLGNLVAGIGLDIISWPRGTGDGIPVVVPPETVVKLGILYGPVVAVFAIVAIWCLSHYDLTRERHREIQLALRRRHEASEAESIRQSAEDQPA